MEVVCNATVRLAGGVRLEQWSKGLHRLTSHYYVLSFVGAWLVRFHPVQKGQSTKIGELTDAHMLKQREASATACCVEGWRTVAR